jgi:DNA-binding transcriptional LysR family regulator
MRDDPIPFDLRSLEAFLTVCDHGTMAAAARALGVTQPAISQTIAELEERTRTVLFDRSVRPLGLTPSGAVLRQRASGLLADARQISPLLREARRGNLPLLRVGFVESLSRALMPELATHLSTVADYVSFVWGMTASHTGAILNRRLEVFVGVDDIESLDGLEKRQLIEEPYVVHTKVGREVELHLRRVGLDLPRSQEFNTPFGVTSTVAHGASWAITTPLCTYESGISMQRLRIHPLPGPRLRRRLVLIARRQELRRLPLEIARFSRDLLQAKVLPAICEPIPWITQEIDIGDPTAPR